MTTRLDQARRTGDHGTHEQALTFALDHADEPVEFLRAWREGSADEWPEYYEWLERWNQ